MASHVCEVTDRCSLRPYVRVSVRGADRELVPEVKACRRHVSIVLGEYFGMGTVIVEGLK